MTGKLRRLIPIRPGLAKSAVITGNLLVFGARRRRAAWTCPRVSIAGSWKHITKTDKKTITPQQISYLFAFTVTPISSSIPKSKTLQNTKNFWPFGRNYCNSSEPKATIPEVFGACGGARPRPCLDQRLRQRLRRCPRRARAGGRGGGGAGEVWGGGGVIAQRAPGKKAESAPSPACGRGLG